MNNLLLKQKAKDAYEWGRLKAAARFLWIVLPLILLSISTRGDLGLPLIVGSTLALAVVTLKWRGEEYGFPVGPGLLAGVTAFSIPLVMHMLEICCRSNLEVIFCVTSGILGGLIIGRSMGRSKRKQRAISLAIGLFIAGSTAALGCISFEIGALVGLLAALATTAISSFAFFSSHLKS